MAAKVEKASKMNVDTDLPPEMPFIIPRLPSFGSRSAASSPAFGLSVTSSERMPSAPLMMTNVKSRRIRSQSASNNDELEEGGMTPQPVDSTLPPHTLSNASSAGEDSMLMELCVGMRDSTGSVLSPPPGSPPPPGSNVHTPPPSPGLKLKGPGSPRLPFRDQPDSKGTFGSLGSSDFGTSAMSGAAKVLSFQNLSSMSNSVNSRVSPSYSMFQTVKEDKVEGDYDCIGETGQLYLGSLESGFTQNFDTSSVAPPPPSLSPSSSPRSTSKSPPTPKLAYKAVLHHNCSQLLICTHSINTETLEIMQTELSSRNCKVSFVSSAEEDCVQQCARLILPAPLRTFVVCDDGDRVGPAIIATYMLWKESGTYNDWINWVQGYRPSTEKGWWKGRKRKGSSEVTDTECDSDGPAPSLTATDPGMEESPKRTKPNEAYDIDEELFIGNPAKCNFTTHRDPALPTSDSPTPLLTPPPPATHGLEWPSGLTFDCGMINSEELRDQMETPGSGNQTTGLTPMMQGKTGGDIEGGFSLS